MNSSKPTPRLLQQQPERHMDRRQQQMSGSGDFQPRASGGDSSPPQMGEGSYEGTRRYQQSIRQYLDHADVKADAKAAKPDSPAEAREMRRAEDKGKSHSKAPGE